MHNHSMATLPNTMSSLKVRPFEFNSILSKSIPSGHLFTVIVHYQSNFAQMRRGCLKELSKNFLEFMKIAHDSQTPFKLISICN